METLWRRLCLHDKLLYLKLQIGKCKLKSANWKVQIENWKVQIGKCKLKIANWKVQIENFIFPSVITLLHSIAVKEHPVQDYE